MHIHTYILKMLSRCFTVSAHCDWCAWMETSWYRMFMISIDFRRFSVKRSKSDNIKKNNLSVLMLVFSSYWNLLCCHFVLSLTFTRIVFITAGVSSVSYSSAYVWIVWCFVCQCVCVCVFICVCIALSTLFSLSQNQFAYDSYSETGVFSFILDFCLFHSIEEQKKVCHTLRKSNHKHFHWKCFRQLPFFSLKKRAQLIHRKKGQFPLCRWYTVQWFRWEYWNCSKSINVRRNDANHFLFVSSNC